MCYTHTQRKQPLFQIASDGPTVMGDRNGHCLEKRVNMALGAFQSSLSLVRREVRQARHIEIRRRYSQRAQKCSQSQTAEVDNPPAHCNAQTQGLLQRLVRTCCKLFKSPKSTLLRRTTESNLSSITFPSEFIKMTTFDETL